MNYAYMFVPGALAEYKEAVEWYKERSETATENLITEVKKRIEAICIDPLRYRNIYEIFRETSLKNTPITLFTLWTSKQIQLLSRHYIIIKEIQKRNTGDKFP